MANLTLRGIVGRILTWAEVDGNFTALNTELGQKVVKEAGKGLSENDYTTSEKEKLSGIAPEATKNRPDAELLARANHTGTQDISTITGLQTVLDGFDTDIGTLTGELDDINLELDSKLDNVITTKSDLIVGGEDGVPTRLPVGTEGQVVSVNGDGELVYTDPASGATGGGNNKIFYGSDSVMTEDFTVDDGRNYMAAGPLTIEDGVTLTVEVGSTVTIV